MTTHWHEKWWKWILWVSQNFFQLSGTSWSLRKRLLRNHHMNVLAIEFRSSIPEIQRPPLGVKWWVESMFEVAAKCKNLSPRGENWEKPCFKPKNKQIPVRSAGHNSSPQRRRGTGIGENGPTSAPELPKPSRCLGEKNKIDIEPWIIYKKYRANPYLPY